ncbi:MAG: glycine cleavage system aminomethyltransferase GcvT [Candidatus Protistobacter heckmanni]|nr:glycine cleavage system aminomethyltransferase GcvT [Candidatus Protistobacter heckmanni]
MRRTSLFELHREAGAKLIDFGGWEMPVHYGSQLEEHEAVRTAAGMFDVSHMRVVDLLGADCRAFLRIALANDVAKLKISGRALYSCMLNPAGGVIDDLIVYFFAEDRFRLVVNAGTADGDIAWLTRLTRERFPALRVMPRPELAMIAVQGPRARDLVWNVFPETHAASAELPRFAAAVCATAFGEMMTARTGYTGEDGFEIVLPAASAAHAWCALAAAGARPAGLGARDTLRLEAGMHLYGQDMDDTVPPTDAGLTWTVSMDENDGPERDFVGCAALAAHAPRTQLCGLLLQGSGVLRSHQTVHTPAGDGLTTSGTYSPTLKRAIALARLPLAVKLGDAVEVDIRGKRLPAKVVKLPFVRNGKTLVDLT